jgi:hypothetical protein
MYKRATPRCAVNMHVLSSLTTPKCLNFSTATLRPLVLQCERVVVHEMKRKEYIKKIVYSAQRTGVANVTLVWREFSACSKTMVAVALEVIAAVRSLKNVYVLGSRHFQLLSAKIEDNSVALRRWFVKSNPERHRLLMTYKLVSKQRTARTMGKAKNPNLWSLARRCDKALWREGQRHHARLSWLSAPRSAFDAASTFKVDMQNSTCNWATACALREDAE